jgi:hypothetical protein
MASSLSRGGHKELGEGAGRSSYPTTSKDSCCASQQICQPMTEMGQTRPGRHRLPRPLYLQHPTRREAT